MQNEDNNLKDTKVIAKLVQVFRVIGYENGNKFLSTALAFKSIGAIMQK